LVSEAPATLGRTDMTGIVWLYVPPLTVVCE
jgi:hypothetical protein